MVLRIDGASMHMLKPYSTRVVLLQSKLGCIPFEPPKTSQKALQDRGRLFDLPPADLKLGKWSGLNTLRVIFTFRRVVEIPKALGVPGSDTFEPLD